MININHTSDTIQSLWIGPYLSTMEQLSIKSFLKNGHAYHLYAYGEIANVPDGAIVKDGNEIIPVDRIFKYGAAAKEGKGSYSGFSNFFRYELLRKRSGYWVDSDVICLKKFDFDTNYVFASEVKHVGNPPIATSCVLKSPANSYWANYCCEVCNSKTPDNLRWGETGPELVQEAVLKFNLLKFVLHQEAICPIHYFEADKFFTKITINENWYAVHLWNEIWSRNKYDKNGTYDPDCLYEILKGMFL